MINLLPPELTVDKNMARAISNIRSVTLFSLVVFLFTLVGIGALFVVSSLELRDLTQKEETLTEQIKARETTETRLILLKDRLAKIKSARSSSSTSEELTGISQILSVLGVSSQVPDLSLDTEKASIDIIFRNATDLNAFIESLPTLTEFKSVVMPTFGFNPISGYFVSLKLTSEKKLVENSEKENE